MSDDLVKRLRDGIVEYPKRWSGDTHSDKGGPVDYDATDDLLDESADRIEELEAENARLREAQTWRPIETAPRDGTEILGLFPEGPADLDGTVCLMWWYQAPPWRPDDSGWETHWGFNGDESGPTHWWPRAALQEGEG